MKECEGCRCNFLSEKTLCDLILYVGTLSNSLYSKEAISLVRPICFISSVIC